MKRSLIWFSILYGELNALVLLVVLGSEWVGTKSGQAFCSRLSLDASSCRVGVLGVISTSLVIAGALTVRRLQADRRLGLQEKQPETKTGANLMDDSQEPHPQTLPFTDGTDEDKKT